MTQCKSILITGGSQNLGAALTSALGDLGSVVSVARSGNVTEQGDLLDKTFRDYLIEKYSPDIFVNCAGKTNHFSTEEILLFNNIVVPDLLFRFYNKSKPGCDIINISSWRGWHSGFDNMDEQSIAYASTKHMLSSASQMLALQKKPNVRVMCVEPGGILTSAYSKTDSVTEKNYNEFDGTQTAPMTPAYVASVVRWMIEQPRWVNPGVVRLLNNFQS